MNKPSILCVDDERMVLSSLRDQLKPKFGHHYHIVIAENGRDALEIITEMLAANQEIPLIIADYIMPDIKGDELLHQVYQITPRTVSVLLTGQATIQGVAGAVNRGKVYKYIEKPWDKENLYTVVSQALDSYHRQPNPAENRKLLEQNTLLKQTITQQDVELTIHHNLLESTEQNQYIRRMVEEITAEINQSLQTIRYGVEAIHYQQKAIYENSPESMAIYLQSVTDFYQQTSAIFDSMVDVFDCSSINKIKQPTANGVFAGGFPDGNVDDIAGGYSNGDADGYADGYADIYRKASAISSRISENVNTMMAKACEVETPFSRRLDKIVAWDDEVIHLFNTEDVLFFTVEDGNTMVVTKKGKYKMKESLNVLENRLNQQNFFRCHKSFLINLVYISQIIPWIGNNYISRIEGFPYEIPISRNHLKEMKDLLGI